MQGEAVCLKGNARGQGSYLRNQMQGEKPDGAELRMQGENMLQHQGIAVTVSMQGEMQGEGRVGQLLFCRPAPGYMHHL